MFGVGDKVLYPVHGAGIIEAIEAKEILGEVRKYYVMKVSLESMSVMIPVDGAENLGIRDIISLDFVDEVLKVLRSAETAASESWNKRYRVNMEKIKSGDICLVAQVVRDLMKRYIAGSISSGERRMLDYARKIMISELMLSTGKSEEAISALLLSIYSPDVAEA